MAFYFLGESSKERETQREKGMAAGFEYGLGHLKGKGAISHLSGPSFSCSWEERRLGKCPFQWPHLLKNNPPCFTADAPERNRHPSVGL